MPLIFLGGPSVPHPVGAITRVVNAKRPSANAMNWSFEQTGGWFQAQRRYTNTLIVTTNSPFVGPIQIQQFILGIGCVQGATYRFPLPEYGNPDLGTPSVPTETDTASFAQTISITEDGEDGKQWSVVINYSSFSINHEFGSSQVQDGSINPTDSAPEVHWSSAKYEVYYPIDFNGNPYVNTVGDPLDNPPAAEETRQVLSFTRNESQYVESWAAQYRDAVNSDTFLGFLPNQVKCKDIQANRVYSADYGYFWRVSYEFEFRIGFPKSDGTTTGWTTEILNAGLRQLVNTNGNSVPSQISINGSLITAPVALTQAGQYEPGSDPFYLEFTQYGAVPFSFLNIPDDVLTASQ